MKKIFILAALVILTVSLASAQIKIGVKGGLNVASMDFETEYETDVSPRASFHLGGFFNYGFSDHFGFQGELLYSGQGAKFEFEDPSFGIDVVAKTKLNYLSLPLLVRYHSSGGLALEAGIGIDFLLSAEVSYDDTEFVQGVQISDQDIKDDLNGTDIKFIIGAGYELPSGLSVNLRYSAGLDNNIKDGSNPYFYEDDEAYNYVIQLGVGFPLYGN